MKKILIALVVCMFSAYGDQLNLQLENDCFIPNGWPGRGDHDFTHGTCIEYVYELMHFKVSQNMYAPSDLSRTDHIKDDRPYAGLLYGAFGYEMFDDPQSPWTHYAEIDLGVIGPAAFCKQTQRFVHKVLGCKEPRGWDNQLHNEVVINGQWWTKYNWMLCDYVALVPRVGVLAGTIEDAAEVGCDLKIGWNLQKDVGNTLMFSTSKSFNGHSFFDDMMAYAYAGVDERYYLYNHMLEGSLFGTRDDGLDVAIEPFVGEAQCGACFKYKNFIAKYYVTFRQREFRHQKHCPNYAGFLFGWEF